MALRAVEHIFNGATTPISSYDSTKTNLGTLMVQRSGSNPEDNFVGPMPIAIARPMEESTGVTMMFPHAITYNATTDWVFLIENAATATKRIFLYEYNKIQGTYNWKGFITATTPTATNVTRGFRALKYTHSTGTVAVAAPVSYYAAGTSVALANNGAVTGVGTTFTAAMVGKMIGFGSTNPAQINCWYPIVSFASITSITVSGASNAIAASANYVIADCTVTGVGTKFIEDGIAAGTTATSVVGGLGPRIGFGSTDPTQITKWYHIGAIASDTSLNINTSPGIIPAGTPYVIEELRFAIATTNGTSTNGGLFLLKGAGYHDFTTAGTTFPSIATAVDNQRGVYWLSDAGTTANVVTNTAGCGLTIQAEINKGLHYAYVIDGLASAYAKVYRYNLRATGTITSGKMLMNVSYYTTGTVGVSNTAVTGSGTTFTAAMVGMKIGFGSTSPATITTWYTISAYTSATSITLSSSAGTIAGGTSFIIDSADVICTGNELITGTISGVNNGRIGTLNHGPGAGEESIYFVTTTRIYRAALWKIFAGNLNWISDNRPEIPPGSLNTFAATGALNSVEIADAIDRLIVLSTGASGIRHYITKYTNSAGDQFDHIFGVDDKQQDQALLSGNNYISNGTVAVSGTAVTGTNTSFVSSMIGFRIGFGSTDPTQISTWYTISAYTSATSITLSSSAGTISNGSSYVIDWNTNTIPHLNTNSQIMSIWSENGIAHFIKHGTTNLISQMYALPLSAHWSYAPSTNQRAITPAIYTPNCVRYNNVIVTDVGNVNSGELNIPPEPYRIYFRTKGIMENVGEWIPVSRDGNLTGVNGAKYIQFMFEFATIGLYCIPNKVSSITVTYEDAEISADTHYQPSIAKSDAINKRFAWRFATSFGSTVPTLKIKLYDAVTGELLVEDNSVAQEGIWEKTTDGSTWTSYNNSDVSNENTYIRFTPLSLGDNIKVRAILTQ